ncbi:MAG: hypothetical protein IPJ02_18010 [Chitinophagaceae bacterium]|nr:hypothetical protein [Chitinophagaceae bacterium]
MKQHEATDSVRINKELLDKIREVAKAKRQTIAGYMELKLLATVERDWQKLHAVKNGFQQD